MTSAKQGTEALRIMDEAAAQLSKAGFDNMSISEASLSISLEMLRTVHGHRTVAGLSRERIVTGILQPYADRPGAALDTLKKLRILIRHAINIGWLKYDPSLGIKRPKIKKIRSWTDAEIEQFKQRWPLGTKQRAAYARTKLQTLR